ncbi:MAG: signal peptide peptidase SppA [Alphaproteobacteria bacterium]|nr:signal peptide peptidase SppA [Alphaproteobacteria bacterium]
MEHKQHKALRLIGKTIVYAFAGFGLIFILMLLGVLSLMSPKSKLAAMPKSAILELDLDTAYAEVRQDDFVAEFMDQSVYGVFDLVRAINFAATDDRVKALSATLNITSLDLAQIQDISEALTYFKSQGKKTYLFSSTMGSFGQGTKEYAFATLFDEIWLQPHGHIGMTGVNIEVPFFKNILQKIGVTPEFYTRYEYKTAMSSLMNADFTPAYKAEIENLGRGFYDELTAMMAQNRHLDSEKITKLIDQAPIFADDALTVGLIDHIGYRYQLNDMLQKQYSAEPYDMADYMSHIGERDDDRLPEVAFWVLEGIIDSGESTQTPLREAVIGSETVLAQLEELKKRPNLKALVLRINSPGGSYTASDEIRAAVEDFKAQKNIPVVVSMGSYAASGGYFISLAGDYLFADPATITGSIGVLGGKFVVNGLMDKLDINWAQVKFGQNAGILSIHHTLSNSEKAVFEKSLDDIYQDFTAKVAKARHIDMAEMDKIARGRVWLGRAAQQLHLVDELGGLQHALVKAKNLAGIDSSQKFILTYYPRRETLQEKLTRFSESGGNLPLMKALQEFDDVKVLNRLNGNAILPPFIVKM